VGEIGDLGALLPTGVVWALERRDAGVTYVDEPDNRFIPPPLDIPEDADTSAVLVISASAAVGKTMLAKEIAARTRSSYWDLARFRVGNNFLPGTIGKVFGFNQTGAVVEALRTGDAAIVLDALDETQVSSGEANFLAFLADLGELLAELSPPRPVMVLLARDDTAEYSVAFLRSAGARVARVRLLYFDEARASQFVDQALDVMHDFSSSQFRQRYAQAKEAVFQLLARSLARIVQ
jgi:nicotinamide riboside kinase